MQITTDKKYINIFKALASDVRLDIINLLSDQSMNIKDIAAALNLSSAIITMHIKKLEDAGIIYCETVNLNGGRQKMCILNTEELKIVFPNSNSDNSNYHELSMPIGHFTSFQAHPTCGLASGQKLIGQFDEVRSFMEPERIDAQILWLTDGFVEYTLPNYLIKGQTPSSFTVSVELGSEFPGVNDNWPSEITFFINDVNVGSWISPGDCGNKRGKLNPAWWNDTLNQYGFLKQVTITNEGTFIDGKLVSDVTLDEVGINCENESIRLRISVSDEAMYNGGLTIYGSQFGNYEQDILVRTYYSNNE